MAFLASRGTASRRRPTRSDAIGCTRLNSSPAASRFPIDIFQTSLRDDSAEVDGVSKKDLAKVVAAMHCYGIGVTVSRPTAACLLLLTEAEIDKSTLAGIVANDIKEGESPRLQTRIEGWNPKKWRDSPGAGEQFA